MLGVFFLDFFVSFVMSDTLVSFLIGVCFVVRVVFVLIKVISDAGSVFSTDRPEIKRRRRRRRRQRRGKGFKAEKKALLSTSVSKRLG